MVIKSFLSAFEYRLDHGKITVNLLADVEIESDPSYYIVRNIRSKHDKSSPAIPDVRLTKKDSAWVHFDSQKATALTSCIGYAIEVYEQQ